MDPVADMVIFFRPHFPRHRSRLVWPVLDHSRPDPGAHRQSGGTRRGLRQQGPGQFQRQEASALPSRSLDEDAFARQMAALLSSPRPWILILDRTNWEWRAEHQRALPRGGHQGAPFPLLWTFLDKRGNSIPPNASKS